MFDPYTGPWTFDAAAHLLRRTIFGPTKERILQAVNDGMEATFDTLFAAPPAVDPPVYFDYDQDPLAGEGETWVDKTLDPNVPDIYFNRAKTLWAWWYRQMATNDQTITEKLTLFWHNHFPITDAGHANMNWVYLNLLRDKGLGNFRELVKDITVDRSMLIYLSGTFNFADEPNENYARELLELFTIGKGDLVAPGDYTNYTEQDIAEIARCLTGWWVWNDEVDEPYGQSNLTSWGHDTGTKQLSYRFDNAIITNQGEEEYKTVIDIIFQKEECAYFICRRLYTWFVHYDITDEIEAQIIAPMAQVLLDNDYEIRPALEALLRSQHFFDTANRGCMIKNPLDFFFSVYNTFKVQGPTDLLKEYEMWLAFYWEFEKLEMNVFQIPSVAGWKAYYQAPLYYRNWINSASLTFRKRTTLVLHWIIDYVDDTAIGYDFLSFIATLDNPVNVNDLISEICSLIYPREMTTEQQNYFKQVLLQGLPDFEWTVEYTDYLADPSNEDLKQALEDKLFWMFQAMMNVPEFQLS